MRRSATITSASPKNRSDMARTSSSIASLDTNNCVVSGTAPGVSVRSTATMFACSKISSPMNRRVIDALLIGSPSAVSPSAATSSSLEPDDEHQRDRLVGRRDEPR